MQADAGKVIDICLSLQMKQIVKIREEGEAGVAPSGSTHPHVLMHAVGHGWPAEKSISGGCCQDVWTTRATAGTHSSFLCPPPPSSVLPSRDFFFLSAKERGGWSTGVGGSGARGSEEGRKGRGGVRAGGSVVRLRLGEGFSHPQRAWRNSIWPGSKVLLGAWFCLVASYCR